MNMSDSALQRKTGETLRKMIKQRHESFIIKLVRLFRLLT